MPDYHITPIIKPTLLGFGHNYRIIRCIRECLIFLGFLDRFTSIISSFFLRDKPRIQGDRYSPLPGSPGETRAYATPE